MLEKHPETHRKELRYASQSFPPPQTYYIRHIIIQELPIRLHRAWFLKLQASFKLKLVWCELMKVPSSHEQ